ncbi:MAG: hypothetical protein JHD33_00110 [Chthoniobacterales bacterium]|nr:hypothetical protein [Chthoniobacterales bacterium]
MSLSIAAIVGLAFSEHAMAEGVSYLRAERLIDPENGVVRDPEQSLPAGEVAGGGAAGREAYVPGQRVAVWEVMDVYREAKTINRTAGDPPVGRCQLVAQICPNLPAPT